MSTTPYIDESGFHAPEYETILNNLQAEYKRIYGDDIYIEPDSQDGEAIAVEALAKYDTIVMAQDVYRSYSPSTARGTGLDSAVKINGIKRDKSSYSTAPIRCVGQIGATITDGMVGGDMEAKWILPSPVVIPPTGECLVTATADRPGSFRAAPGEIYRILTPTRGWQDAVNTEKALPGAPVEEDGELRQRQTISTALPSLTVLDGTIGAVANVTSVTRCRDYENDTNVFDKYGIPPHRICIVAEGGDPAAIANAINIKKTPGCGTYGDIRELVYDEYGVPKYIYFFRPIHVRVRGRIKIKSYYGYRAATGEKIRQYVVNYINSMRIGMNILRSRLVCPIAQSEAEAGARTFDVDLDGLLLAADDGALLAQNIAVPFNGMATAEVNDFEVVVERDSA